MDTLKLKTTVHTTEADTAEEVAGCRQILRRWRRRGKIPAGYRQQSAQVLFTREAVKAVYTYANRVDPIESSTAAEEPKWQRLRAQRG